MLKSTNKRFKELTSQRIQLAVTGLSGSGKTTFITSLITQLITANTVAKLPFVEFINENRWLGGKLENHKNSEFVRFAYEESIHRLQKLAQWPGSTNQESHIVLELCYLVKPSLSAKIWPKRVLELEIIDYPGEWLADIPMLNMHYFEWSKQILNQLKTFSDLPEGEIFAEKMRQLQKNVQQPSTEKLSENSTAFTHAVEAYKNWLNAIKKKSRYCLFLQPGRFISPGHLLQTPLLNFFPWDLTLYPLKINSPILHLVEHKYRTYQTQVIKPFVKDFFSRCSRQIILVDLISAVNAGTEAVLQLQKLLKSSLQVYQYGSNNWFRRLIKPNIEKVLMTSSKADLLPPDQHRKMQQLLSSLLVDGDNPLLESSCQFKALAISAIRATENRIITEKGQEIQAVCGRLLHADLNNIDSDRWVTVVPGSFPDSLEDLAGLDKTMIDVHQFKPPENWQLGENALPHIRMDQVIEFLLGDLLQ